MVAVAVTGPDLEIVLDGGERSLLADLDHLIAGSKESRLAADVAGPHVLVTGHPFVDVWEAVSPGCIGLERWPQVPLGTPWKEGIISTLGLRVAPGEFWGEVLEAVTSYRDLETALVNAVEQLIDFVTAET